MARHFQHKVEVYFKEMVLDGPLGETKYYVYVMNFRKWVAPHVHSFTWIFKVPNIHNKAAYTKSIKNVSNYKCIKKINTVSQGSNEPGLFELVKNYQIHSHS